MCETCTAVRSATGVDEAPLGHEPRRRRREHEIADQRDRHRDHEHVAHEVEAAVVAQVQIQQRRDRDGVCAFTYSQLEQLHHEVAARGPRLDRGLDEQVQRALQRDQVAGVREGGVGARPRRGPARGGRRGRPGRTARPAAARPAIRGAGGAPAERERGRPSTVKPRRCSSATGPVIEDADKSEADHDAHAARRGWRARGSSLRQLLPRTRRRSPGAQ